MLRLALRCSLGVTAAYSLSMTASARRADNHLTIVATGGTFDKDYPRSTRGYAFEIDEPAAGRVLDGMPFLGLSYDVVSVCRKDSTEIDADDRAAIAGAVASAAGRLVVVTHGTDTLIESARHVARSGSAAGKSVVFCGAMKPERFKDSDAAFNFGAAVGATSLLPPGAVVIVMGGNVIDCAKAERDLQNGLFVERSAAAAVQ